MTGPRRRTRLWRAAVAGALTACALMASASVARAHPLGNFTVNHYDGLTLRPDRIDDLAVLDDAEIPTLQARPTRDSSPAGIVAACAQLAGGLSLTIDGRPAPPWQVTASSLTFTAGAAGLPTSRLTCSLTAPVPPGMSLDTGSSGIHFTDAYQSDRIGWHEVTATTASGVRLASASVPARTVSDELRHYPGDLLASPLDVRTATLHTGRAAASRSPAAFAVSAAGPFSRALQHVNALMDSLVGARRLSLGVALLALALSLVLGASHAALPGHGKTVMAAYLAGRGGGIKDAVTVGATVTVTHTAGVIILGLILSTSARFAGEEALRWLGLASGLLIAGIGTGLLRGAWRTRRVARGRGREGREEHGHPGRGDEHRHDVEHGHGHEHEHEHGHEHEHEHEHRHGHGHPHRRHGHTHGHGQDHGHHHHDHESRHRSDGRAAHAGHAGPAGRVRRRGLIGMGVAGGLVPSPSALVVLLGAVALGRTAFGLALVLGYGIGMAAALTAAGLLLLRLRDTMRPAGRRLSGLGARVAPLAPMGTALLVVVVGSGLAIKSL